MEEIIQSKISIVLPTHNGSRYLRQAIDSCLTQSHPHIELIVVDDASTDETPTILAAYDDLRLQIIRNETNQGLPRSLNTGFSHATGDYLTWTSDDNYYDPRALEIMLAVLVEKKADFVYCDYYAVNESNGSAPKRIFLAGHGLAEGNYIGACFLYSKKVRDALGNYNPDRPLVEDYDYWCRVAQTFPLHHLPQPLYFYRQHAASLSATAARTIAQVAIPHLLVRLENKMVDVKAARESLIYFWARLIDQKIHFKGSIRLYGLWKRIFFAQTIDNLLTDFAAGQKSFEQAKTILYVLLGHRPEQKGSNGKTILYVHNGRDIGGGERSLLALFDGLRERHKILVACPPDTPFARATQALGATIIPFEFCGVRHIVRLWRTVKNLCRAIKEEKVDLIHSQTPQTNFPAGVAGRWGGVPVVWHARVLLDKGMTDLDEIFAWLPNHILCNSEAIRRRFLGIKDFARKTTVVLNGVDTDAFCPTSRSADKEREALNLPPRGRVIGCFDRLDPVKNHELILDAFALVHQKCPDAILLISGEAFENKDARRHALEAKIKTLAVPGNRVRFTGFLEDVRGAMSACTLVVQASVSEGCSRALCEAQAMGQPVVASNIGGNPEIVDEKKTGFLFDLEGASPTQSTQDLADKLILLLSDESLRTTMGAQARQWAQDRLSLDAYITQTENVYARFWRPSSERSRQKESAAEKKVLIVSHDYDPQPHAASVMVRERARHLAAQGWTPVILTRHWKAGQTEPAEETQEPLAVEQDPAMGGRVYRTPYRQFMKPWLSRLSRLCPRHVRFKILNFTLRTFFFHPCERRGWAKDAVDAGVDAVRNENIAAILSIGSPWTDHLVSRAISRRTHTPWVALYMDPWTQTPSAAPWRKKTFSVKWALSRFIGRRVEQNICRHAFAAVHNSTPWAKDLAQILKINVQALPYGVDQSDFAKLEPMQPPQNIFTLAYIGTIHFTQKTNVFHEGLTKFVQDNNIPADRFKLKIIGSQTLGDKFTAEESLRPYVETIPYLPREDALKQMRQAHGLLLFLMNDNGWYPMKVFEYLSTDALILATPRDYGVIDALLEKTGKGAALDHPEEVAEWLKEKWDVFCAHGAEALKAPHDATALTNLNRKENTRKLAELLDDMVNRH